MCKIVKNRETPYKIWKNVAYKCKNKDRRVEKSRMIYVKITIKNRIIDKMT